MGKTSPNWLIFFFYYCEVSTINKASGSDRIPVELFQILKDDALKVLHSVCQKIWKTQQWPRDWKRSVFISVPKRGNAKECSNYRTIALISHTSKSEVKSHSRFWLFATSWTVAHQAPLSLGFSRQEHWSGLPFPSEMSAIVRKFEHSLALCFFGTEMKTDLFQSCGHCWVFQICWHIECSTFRASSFSIWNSSTEIPFFMYLK